MASLSSSAASAASTLPASAAADPLTSVSPSAAAAGFRSPSAAMGELPRLLLKAATFGFLGSSGDAGLAASAGNVTQNASAAATDAFQQHGAAAAAAAANSSAGAVAAGSVAEGVRSVSGVFTYITSRWAVLCLFMTVLLNRTLIYASLRRPIYLPFKIRLLMRIVPIVMFAVQASHIMMAMRCQSSSIFRGARGDDASLATSDGFFYQVGRLGSWWKDDRAVCERIGMIPDQDWIAHASSLNDTAVIEDELQTPEGSLHLLWPLYKTLSLSQFVEVFACALIGRQPASETGMTLLEHSLAFAEAEALASRKTYRLETTPDEDDGSDTPSRVVKLQGKKLVPAEVLYISLISALGHVTSHVLAIFNRQSRYRLISTGAFGLAFLGGFALALYRGGTYGILDFPTVCVVGFIPHLLIFAAIAVCGAIYALALVLSSLFPPSGRRGLSEGFGNLRANLTLSTINVSLSEDFYTTLLKLGFMCLTAASEATYLNEGRAVRVPGWTWLEGERAKLLSAQHAAGVLKPAELISTGRGAGPYTKERKDGKGIVEGGKKNRRPSSGKWAGAMEMVRGVGVVLARWSYGSVGRVLAPAPARRPPTLHSNPAANDVDDEDDASRLYAHFVRSGTPLGDDDESADFVPRSDAGSPTVSSLYSSDEETPSPSVASSSDIQISRRYSQRRPGRRTSGHRARTPRSPTPPADTALAELFETPARLAAMLDPQSPEDRAAARTLARHLVAPKVLTRGAFERDTLGGGQEEGVLEGLLVERRRAKRPAPAASAAREDWMADGMEADEDDPAASASAGGPMCVVCQSEPRTIIVWPCRCLSLCEDCRVCLAMNNFANCVCCRRELEGFSRIYIP